jgi:PAS domain-containing protein
MDRDDEVTTWSPTAQRMCGWSEEEVLGQSPRYVPVVGVHGILEGITDRKRAEEALRKSARERKAVLRSIPIVLYRA